MIKLLILLCFLIIASDASVSDFCVADYNGPQSATGYSCKNPANVTVNDFVFAGLAKPGNLSSLVKAAVTPATAAQFPGLNGLGISVARLDFAPGGFIPLHSHPGATEILLVIKGSLTTGFIDSANQVFLTTLKKGELIIYPQGLLHFRVNTGRKRAVAFSSFSSQNPGLQVTASALFGNNLPSALIEETVFLDPAEVKKLKAIFGGTG